MCADFDLLRSQVVNHDVSPELMSAFRNQMQEFFDLPIATKKALRRSANNARGFFDDELTKRRRDWKEALDFGVPGSRDWSLPDEDRANAMLDGFNQFPAAADLPHFRGVMSDYFDEMTGLSERIAASMAEGLGMRPEYFDELLHHTHTSYLRLNYYPPCTEPGSPPPLGISPHADAGFLTVLEQDVDCHSLQVARKGCPLDEDASWSLVEPVAGAFTINTGDMAQIWSNGRYHAPVHRVLTHPSKQRYSAPYFYNPGYRTKVEPLPTLGAPRFNTCVWGYYRALRFAGDFADFGTEIQASHFLEGSASPHIERQQSFLAGVDFATPFSIKEYEPLLRMDAA